MNLKSKNKEMRDFVALNIINGVLKDGDKLYDKEFFMAKFRVNPSYLELAYDNMVKEGIIEARSDYYYLIVNDEIVESLKNEFANIFINDYFEKMKTLGLNDQDSFNLLARRMNSYG